MTSPAPQTLPSLRPRWADVEVGQWIEVGVNNPFILCGTASGYVERIERDEDEPERYFTIYLAGGPWVCDKDTLNRILPPDKMFESTVSALKRMGVDE